MPQAERVTSVQPLALNKLQESMCVWRREGCFKCLVLKNSLAPERLGTRLVVKPQYLLLANQTNTCVVSENYAFLNENITQERNYHKVKVQSV